MGAAEIQTRAVAIAEGGYHEVQAGDRRHRLSDASKLYELSRRMAADDEDATYGGVMDVIFQNPT
jgi:hypothetical protein